MAKRRKSKAENLDRYAQLTYPENFYNPHTIRQALSESEMRAEYRRLQKIAEQRLEKFVGTEYEDSKAYQRNKNAYPKISEIKNRADVPELLSRLSRFIQAESSRVTGQAAIARRTLETLHENGYTFVNKNNLRQFGEFMEYARAYYGGRKFYDSERIAELYETAKKKRIDPEELKADFDFWVRHAADLQEIPRKNKGKLYTSDQLITILEKRGFKNDCNGAGI